MSQQHEPIENDPFAVDPQSNPYQPPAGSVTDEPVRYAIDRADGGRRFLGFVIDYVAHVLILVVILFLVNLVSMLVQGDEEAGDLFSDQPEWIFNVLSALGLFVYYVFFEGLFSRTLGKFVTGTIVVDRDGYPPSFRQILGRTLARFIPFDALSYLGSGARGWHDSLSGTYVVLRRSPRSAADRDEGR